MSIKDQICIVRNTFGDRSPLLRLSLEYQRSIRNIDHINTWIFLDPKIEDNSIDSLYNSKFFNNYPKHVFENHKGRKSWYLAVKYIFDNYDHEYILSIEDDVILSYDYLDICFSIIADKILDRDDVFYLHPGAWEKSSGDPNNIVYSGISSRSILINRKKFSIVSNYIDSNQNNIKSDKIGNDRLLSLVAQQSKLRPIAPIYNRHAHFGVYGWSSSGVHADMRGKDAVIDKSISPDSLYDLLKTICFDGNKLLELNQNKNPKYFWDFDPNINFTKLDYQL